MSANETKVRVLAGVLSLEEFTVSELCLYTGLLPPMVYRELANIQGAGVLTSLADKNRPSSRHRPRKLYRLSNDPTKRDEVRRQILAFMPGDYKAPSDNPHFQTAQTSLTLLADELFSVPKTTEGIEQWKSKLLSEFETVRKELKRATWESGVDFSEDETATHPIAVATRLYRRLRERFDQFVASTAPGRSISRLTVSDKILPLWFVSHGSRSGRAEPRATLPRYIAVEGATGVGKSTLVRILAERLNAEQVMEPESNPFLDSFYEGEPGAAFQVQFAFLVRRFEQLQALDLGPRSQKTVVADYIFEKDKLFACLNLTDEELETYNRYFNHFREQLPTPDLVIYLQATPEVLKKRLEKRNAPGERAVNEEYLKEVVKAYEHFFFHYASSDLLVVNVSDRAVKDLTVEIIEREDGLRQLVQTASGQDTIPYSYNFDWSHVRKLRAMGA